MEISYNYPKSHSEVYREVRGTEEMISKWESMGIMNAEQIAFSREKNREFMYWNNGPRKP